MLKTRFFIFYLFFFLIQSSAWGEETFYKNVGLRSISTYLIKDLEITFQKFGLDRIYIPNEGSKFLGLNLLFSDPFFSSKVAIKYDVEGNFELEKIYYFGNYKVIHFFHEQKNIAILSLNLENSVLLKMVEEVKKLTKKTSYISLFSSAYADDCHSTLNPKINLDFELTEGVLAKSLGECFSNFSEGANDSSVGLVQDMYKNMANLIKNPKQSLNQYYTFATKGLEALWEFSTSVGKMLMDPDSIIPTLENRYGEFGVFIKNTFESIRTLPPQTKTNIICNLLGSLGVDFILTFVTAGAASGKMMLTTSKIISKINKIIKLIGKGISFNSKYIFSLSDDLIDELQIIDDMKQLDILGDKLNKVGVCDFAIR